MTLRASVLSQVGGALVSVIILMLAACSNDAGDAGGGNDRSAAGSPSTQADTPPTKASTPPSSALDLDTCQQAQRRAVQRFADGLWRPQNVLLTSPDGFSVRAARLVKSLANRAEAWVADRCPRMPRAMSRYLGTVRMTADDSLDIDGLRTVYRASIGWTNEVGSDRAPDMRRGLQDFNLCHELGQRIIAASRVWWRWTESGKAWWIEMTFSNRTDFHLWASLGGTAYGTHLLSSETDQPGSSQFLSWGGSSADITKINPGSGRQLIAPGADVDVHTSSDGTLEIREAYVFVHLPRRITHRYPLDCMIPISQG